MSCAAFKLRFGIIGTNFISDWLLEGAAEDSRFEVAAIPVRKILQMLLQLNIIFLIRSFRSMQWLHRL